jgi:hypothetical protein
MKRELTLFEINDDRPIKEWARELMGKHHHEAEKTLAEEDVIQETVFYLELEGKKYLAFYMEGTNFKPSNPDKEINRKHKEILQSIKVGRFDAELLYDLDVDNS